MLASLITRSDIFWGFLVKMTAEAAFTVFICHDTLLFLAARPFPCVVETDRDELGQEARLDRILSREPVVQRTLCY